MSYRKKNNQNHQSSAGRRKKNGKGKKVVSKPYIGVSQINRELGVLDAQTQQYAYREIPSLQFNTAAQVGAVYYYSNNMAQFLVGTPAAVPFWELISLMYERYVVMHSKIQVEVQNRENVNSVCVCVFPATINTAITTAALFTTVQSLPGAKTFVLQAQSGGMSTHTFRLGCSLPRLVGEQYEEQDQWAGIGSPAGTSCTNALPTSSLYWGIAYYNPTGNNTLTSGGITCQVSIINKVRLNKPIRGPSSDGLTTTLRIPVTSTEPNRPPSFSDQVLAVKQWLNETK